MTYILQPQKKGGEIKRKREKMKGGGTINLRITCVISFYYGNSHIHCGKRLGTIIPRTRRNAKLYTKTLLHTEAFTHKHFCTQTL
jgi:hypothetical protein